MLSVLATPLAFAPAAFRPVHVMMRPAAPIIMLDTPLDALASPLRKWEVPADAAAVDPNANPLTDLPIEVAALFGFIILVGIAGLVKQSGALSESAPTVGLGETREDRALSLQALLLLNLLRLAHRRFRE